MLVSASPPLLVSSSSSSSLTNSGIARRGLHHRLSGFQRPIQLGGLDDGQRQPVLDGRAGVEELALGVDGPAGRADAAAMGDFDEGGVAHRLADVVEGRSVSSAPAVVVAVAVGRRRRRR